MKSYFQFTAGILPFAHVASVAIESEPNVVNVFCNDGDGEPYKFKEDTGTCFCSEYTAWLDAQEERQNSTLVALEFIVHELEEIEGILHRQSTQ